MTAPRRRVWLYVPEAEQLELTMLGALDDIGPLFAALKVALERWHGFDRVEIICSGSACGVLRAVLTNRSTYTDPIAEAMFAIRESDALARLRTFEWHNPFSQHRDGVVGTW